MIALPCCCERSRSWPFSSHTVGIRTHLCIHWIDLDKRNFLPRLSPQDLPREFGGTTVVGTFGYMAPEQVRRLLCQPRKRQLTATSRLLFTCGLLLSMAVAASFFAGLNEVNGTSLPCEATYLILHRNLPFKPALSAFFLAVPRLCCAGLGPIRPGCHAAVPRLWPTALCLPPGAHAPRLPLALHRGAPAG